MGNSSIPLLGVAQTAADVDDGSRGEGSEAQAAQPAAGERECDAVEVQVGDHVEWWLREGHPTQQSQHLLRPTLKLGAGCKMHVHEGLPCGEVLLQNLSPYLGHPVHFTPKDVVSSCTLHKVVVVGRTQGKVSWAQVVDVGDVLLGHHQEVVLPGRRGVLEAHAQIVLPW